MGWNPSGGGGGGGGSVPVTDGTTIVSTPTQIEFDGAAVSNDSGKAKVSVTAVPFAVSAAVADDATDQAAQIQTDLDAVVHGLVALKQSNSHSYLLKNPIIVPDGVALVGMGAMQGGCTLLADAAFPHTTVNGAQTTPASNSTTFTLTVASTAGFPLGSGGITPPNGVGVLCVAGITIFYTGTTATTFTGCTVQAADTNVTLANSRAVSTFMVWLCDPAATASGFGTRLDDIGIDCNGVPGIGGVHSCHIQEGGGWKNLRVTDWANFGIRVDSYPLAGGSDQAVNWEGEAPAWVIFSDTAEPEAVGIDVLKTYVGTGSLKIDSDRGVKGCTFVVKGSVNVVGKSAIRLNGAAGSYGDFHFENMNAGVLVGDIYRSSVTVDDVWVGNNWGSGGVLQIGNIAGNTVRARNIGKSNAASVPARIVVNDLLNGFALTDEQAEYELYADGSFSVNGGDACGLRANRPAAAKANRGRKFFALDTGIKYTSDGNAWHPERGPRVVADAVATGGRDNLSASTLTLTVAKYIPAGKALYVACGQSGNFVASSATDSHANTYTVEKTHSGQGFTANLLSCIVATALAPGDTITVTYSGASTYAAGTAFTLDGLLIQALTDISGANNGASGNPTIASFGPTTQANEVAIGLVAYNSASTLAATAPIQLLTKMTSGAGDRTVQPFIRYLDTTGNLNPQLTGSVGAWEMVEIAVRAEVPA